MKLLSTITVCLCIGATAAFGLSLQQEYDKAGPGEGYDKLLILDPSKTYTGGCGMAIGKKSCIRGKGAYVDLDGGTIIVGSAGAELTIEGCCLYNAGYYGAINVQNGGNAIVNGNTICKSNGIAGIRVWEYSTATIKNNIIYGGATYGIAKHQSTGTTLISYNDVNHNSSGNYMYFCPG
jgi:hypothetical protein